MTLDEIRAEFPGYHIDIKLYPSGGAIDVLGCEQCGTSDDAFSSGLWRTSRGETVADAILRAKEYLRSTQEGRK